MAKRRKKPTSLSAVGSRVKLMWGPYEVTATVIEDRGNVGMRGRHLVRVRLDIPDTAEPIELEMPLEELTAAA